MNQDPKNSQKQVLLIDSSPLFDGFLKEKLIAEQIKVVSAKGDRDAFQKMVNGLPDLIIIDIENDFMTIQDFLDNKLHEPNAARIPTIISGPEIPKAQAQNLIKFGVVKYFSKPIKFDMFFQAIGKVLRTRMTIDETPCILETHTNGNLIFIEIAQGLNRDKIALLRYRLAEILDKNNFHDPRLIVMMTNLDLTFVDGANLELLFDVLIEEQRLKRTNIKVLSMNGFIRDLLAGHPMYNGIEMIEDLTNVLNSFVDSGTTTELTEVVSEKILAVDEEAATSNIEIRFGSDSGEVEEEKPIDLSSLSVAIVDFDPTTRQNLQAVFGSVKAKTTVFENGQSFFQALSTQQFSIIVLDLYLPDVNGFELLNYLKQQNFKTPILVHSMAPSKQFVLQALQFGAKGFVSKPQQPKAILQKCLEILKANQ